MSDVLLPDAHLTYPHCNGFLEGGERVALTRYDPDAVRIVSVRWRDADRDERILHVLPLAATGGQNLQWLDIARDTDRLALVNNNVLLAADAGGALEPVWRPPAGLIPDHLVSLTPDGERIALGAAAEDGSVYSVWEVEVSTGAATCLLEKTWWANHVTRSPFDERWIAFSHEGTATQTPDRVWALHPDKAPNGVCVLDQYAVSDAPGVFVAVGHERWAHHDLAVLAVAYGDSVAGPRGLYLAYPDGRPPRLVAAGERYWHCDISRDGRFAVVDTTGPSDRPGRGWQDADGVSDVLLVDLAGGGGGGGARRIARTTGPGHPWHPHPVFSPDGSAVFYNHCGEVRGAAVVRL